MLGAFPSSSAAGRRRARAPRRAAQPGLRGACVAVLLMSAIFFSALLYLPQFFDEGPRLFRGEVGRRAAADDGRLRGDVVRRRVAVRAARREADRLAGRRRARRSASSCSRSRGRLALRGRSWPGWSCSASGSGFLLLDHDRRRSPRSTRRARAWRAASSTCARSPAARSASASNTAIVASGANLADGISVAFPVDAALRGGRPRRLDPLRRCPRPRSRPPGRAPSPAPVPHQRTPDTQSLTPGPTPAPGPATGAGLLI